MRSNKVVYDYVVVLKNYHKKNIEKTGWLLSVLSILLFTVSIYYYPTDWLQYLFISIIIILFFSNAFESKKNNSITHFRLLLIISGIGIFIGPSIPGFIGMLFILAGLLENKLLQNKEIGFSKSEIKESGLLGKKIDWQELNQVIIKDDILTIDFKNNKIIQAETDDEEDDEYDVGDDEFNTYCRNQISLIE